MAESSVIRFIDEINDVNGDTIFDEILRKRLELKRLKKLPYTHEKCQSVKQKYEEIDELQFVPEYVCLVIDKEWDYIRACEGFTLNGLTYRRLIGTPGGIKSNAIIFICERNAKGRVIGDEIIRRLDNGRDQSVPLVPAKFEAYKALACSASVPVSFPCGVLVVQDCITKFKSNYIRLDDECDGEPEISYVQDGEVEMNASDGYGIISPLLASRWSSELGETNMLSGFCIRNSFCKGMLFPFDFVDFGDKIANGFMVEDAWGTLRDIRDVEMILATSMLKLWSSYNSLEDYLENCQNNNYKFSVTKTCETKQRNYRELNYQFLQSYELSDAEIDELIAPSMEDICGVLGGDIYKTVLFLKGSKQSKESIKGYENDYAKALMINPKVIDDPHLRNRVSTMLKKRIDNAKLGRIRVRGDYSVVSGDPYSLCQSMFKLPVTGLLSSGQVYSQYWNERSVDKITCFRAPMSCHNNIRTVKVHRDANTDYWYRYMKAVIIINSWDTLSQAANGMDFDGDLLFTTDNKILLNNTRNLPTIFCVQRKAEKKIITESDLIKANIASFGDDIGSITNKITAMFEVKSHFSSESPEYKELDYRIMCGQLFQQNAIDKAKGILAKSMPDYWYDSNKANKIDKENRGGVKNCDIVASKSPYFMNFRYPKQKAEHSKYISIENRRTLRKFDKSIDELSSSEILSAEEAEFLNWHYKNMPVGIGLCTMNKICHAVESFVSLQKSVWRANIKNFDYTIYKSEAEYDETQYECIKKIYLQYHELWSAFVGESKRSHLDTKDSGEYKKALLKEIKQEMEINCTDELVLCNILLDITYGTRHGNQLVWDICGDTIIKNVLSLSGGEISYLDLDEQGAIEYNGDTYTLRTIRKDDEIGGSNTK
ncbi:MAG: hypothetical protein RR365_06255 [Bacteroides sp.]